MDKDPRLARNHEIMQQWKAEGTNDPKVSNINPVHETQVCLHKRHTGVGGTATASVVQVAADVAADIALFSVQSSGSSVTCGCGGGCRSRPCRGG